MSFNSKIEYLLRLTVSLQITGFVTEESCDPLSVAYKYAVLLFPMSQLVALIVTLFPALQNAIGIKLCADVINTDNMSTNNTEIFFIFCDF